MGRGIHTTEGLIPPLLSVDERLIDLPPEGELHVTTAYQENKLVVFLEGAHVLTCLNHPTVTVRTGDALIHPRRNRQIYKSLSPKLSSRIHVLRIVMDVPMLKARLSPSEKAVSPRLKNAETQMRPFIRRYFNECYHLPGFLTPHRLEIVERIRNEIENQQLGYKLLVSSLCFDLIVESARLVHGISNKDIDEDLPKAAIAVNLTKEYLIENFSESLTLDKIAWEVRLSREHLARIFRQSTGCTVFEYLTNLRIEAAKTLLSDPKRMIHEIAGKCGFSSPTLFGRTFKRLVGATPLEYRKRQLDNVRFYITVRK